MVSVGCCVATTVNAAIKTPLALRPNVISWTHDDFLSSKIPYDVFGGFQNYVEDIYYVNDCSLISPNKLDH